MADILRNKSGVPLIAFGTKGTFISTVGAPEDKPKSVAEPKNDDPDKTQVGNLEIADWGQSNKFPQTADEIISKTGVLNSGLKFIRNFTLGQGVFPVKVTGYDQDGNEQLEVVQDDKLLKFAKSRMLRRYMEKTLRDYLKFGPAFVQFIPNVSGDLLTGMNTINAKYCRLSLANSMGVIEKCAVSGKWPDTPNQQEAQIIDVLDEYDPEDHLFRLKVGKKITNKSFIYVVRDSWSNNEYYSCPIWWSAQQAGWIEIAQKVPRFLLKAYENQITWKWHVQIPYAFWEKKFPIADYEDTELRNKAIDDYIDEIEENLTGTENADKPIFTMFDINPANGRAEEQWIIKPLENKYDNANNLVTSAAANSEILFSLMLNPNVLGAGMPGGTYAGNQGGSNIREAFLVNIANAWVDRQNVLDPIEGYTRFNGADPQIEWRFRNTILTTLDSGSGTKKNLS